MRVLIVEGVFDRAAAVVDWFVVGANDDVLAPTDGVSGPLDICDFEGPTLLVRRAEAEVELPKRCKRDPGPSYSDAGTPPQGVKGSFSIVSSSKRRSRSRSDIHMLALDASSS
mmetsp:Transcript_65190/g.75800  ORF Transcript_65190/g.75800 Transcript_65190/m.75800 type:complete len:113 (+) Transcript_65190:417-755(+)